VLKTGNCRQIGTISPVFGYTDANHPVFVAGLDKLDHRVSSTTHTARPPGQLDHRHGSTTDTARPPGQLDHRVGSTTIT